MAVVTLAMMLRLQRHAHGDRASARVARLRAAALGLLRAAARARPRSTIVHDRQAAEPLPRDGARRAVDQALRPPGGAAVALAEPRRRCGERATSRRSKLGLGFRVRHNGLVFGVERVAVVWLGALLVLDSALLGRHAVRVRRLQGPVLGARRRAHRQDDRAADAEPAGRAARRHRAHARPRSESTSLPARRRSTPSLEVRDAVASATPTPSPSCCCNCSLRVDAGRVGRDRRPVGRRQDHAAEAHAGHRSRPPTARSCVGGVDIAEARHRRATASWSAR